MNRWYGSGARSALSVLEIVVAAMIIGLASIPVLELIRSSTAALEVTETEAVARGLAADVLERYAGQPGFLGARMGKVTRSMLGAPTRWDQLINDDPSLARGFPAAKLAPLLDQCDARLTLTIDPAFSHPALGPTTGPICFRVTVSFKEREDRRKEVTYARLVHGR